MEAALISAIIGAVVGLAGAYALLRKLPGELREGQEKVNKLREETHNLEEERDHILARTIESVISSARASMALADQTCEERITALEQTIDGMEKRYAELEAANKELRRESDLKINSLMHNLAELVLENEALKNRVASISREVQSVTGRDLLQKKITP